MKRSKKNYYNESFDTNWNAIKNPRKGTKSTLSIKNDLSSNTKILTSSDTTITNPVEIANVLKNYFTLIAPDTKVNHKYSHKHFSGFLKKDLIIPFFEVLLVKMKYLI